MDIRRGKRTTRKRWDRKTTGAPNTTTLCTTVAVYLLTVQVDVRTLKTACAVDEPNPFLREDRVYDADLFEIKIRLYTRSSVDNRKEKKIERSAFENNTAPVQRICTCIDRFNVLRVIYARPQTFSRKQSNRRRVRPSSNPRVFVSRVRNFIRLIYLLRCITTIS